MKITKTYKKSSTALKKTYYYLEKLKKLGYNSFTTNLTTLLNKKHSITIEYAYIKGDN